MAAWSGFRPSFQRASTLAVARQPRSAPMPTYDHDLFVIGAGSGGVRAARLAAISGARVGIAEEDRVGGTCVIRGCIPKKFMVYASMFSHALEVAESYGW